MGKPYPESFPYLLSQSTTNITPTFTFIPSSFFNSCFLPQTYNLTHILHSLPFTALLGLISHYFSQIQFFPIFHTLFTTTNFIFVLSNLLVLIITIIILTSLSFLFNLVHIVLFCSLSVRTCSLFSVPCSHMFSVLCSLFPQVVLQIYQMIGKDSDPQNLPEDAAFNYLGSWSGRNRQVFCASRKLSFIVPSSDKKMSDHI